MKKQLNSLKRTQKDLQLELDTLKQQRINEEANVEKKEVAVMNLKHALENKIMEFEQMMIQIQKLTHSGSLLMKYSNQLESYFKKFEVPKPPSDLQRIIEVRKNTSWSLFQTKMEQKRIQNAKPSLISKKQVQDALNQIKEQVEKEAEGEVWVQICLQDQLSNVHGLRVALKVALLELEQLNAIHDEVTNFLKTIDKLEIKKQTILSSNVYNELNSVLDQEESKISSQELVLSKIEELKLKVIEHEKCVTEASNSLVDFTLQFKSFLNIVTQNFDGYFSKNL